MAPSLLLLQGYLSDGDGRRSGAVLLNTPMGNPLIEKVAAIHDRIYKESADNFARLQAEFRHAHAYWIDADTARRVRDRQRRAAGAIAVTDDCGREVDDQALADALNRWGGEMLVIVWMERTQDATLMELAVR